MLDRQLTLGSILVPTTVTTTVTKKSKEIDKYTTTQTKTTETVKYHTTVRSP